MNNFNTTAVWLNVAFAMIFMVLLKVLSHEIQLKISHKALKILQNENIRYQDKILVVILVQILLVVSLTTVIRLGQSNIVPGKDYLLICWIFIILKIFHCSRETINCDVSGGISLLFLCYFLEPNVQGSVLEITSNLFVWSSALVPIINLGFILSICFILQTNFTIITTIILMGILFKINRKLCFSVLMLMTCLLAFKNIQLFHPASHSIIDSNLHDNNIAPVSQPENVNQIYANFSTKDLEAEKLLKCEQKSLVLPEEEIITNKIPDDIIEPISEEVDSERLVFMQRTYFVRNVKNTDDLCEVDAVDVTEENVIRKILLKITLKIQNLFPQTDLVGTIFNSVQLRGTASDCEELLGTQLISSSSTLISSSNNISLMSSNIDIIFTSDLSSFTSKMYSLMSSVTTGLMSYFH